jgi:hypothetical protein
MYLNNPEKQSKADYFLSEKKSVDAILSATSNDFALLSYIAYKKAQLFDFEFAIELVRYGAHANTVIQLLLINGPQYIEKCKSAEKEFFINRFKASPLDWYKKRSELMSNLKKIRSATTADLLYTENQIEEILKEDGYSLELIGDSNAY